MQRSTLPACHRCAPHEQTESSVRSLHSFYVCPKVKGWSHYRFMSFCLWLALEIIEQVIFLSLHREATSHFPLLLRALTPAGLKRFLELHPYRKCENTRVVKAVSSHLFLAGNQSFVVLVWRLQNFLPLDICLCFSLT